ncbi:hypothetical protein ACFFIS_05580 [Virgibacillus soli]|uniref:2TM domain-containing protein n=1 Tax=Paracerasibacillus soli TaxID=480284 RepID=A0ABU5CV15_9BACI|nr:hypothetical protein [Virgibacillus soli]MDY0409664.1 hypothetical protein [Virgibacillus soli]
MPRLTTEEDYRADGRKSRMIWYVHLVVFVIFQIGFFISQDFVVWKVFNLNQFGEWFVSKLTFLEWIQIHDLKQFNDVTGVWGITLIIHGLCSFIYSFWPRKEKPTTHLS